MDEFKIYNQVIIRFSLRVEEWQIKAAGSLLEEDRDRWFQYRVGIFCRTVVPSLNSQIQLPNRVILLLDVGDKLLWETKFFPHLANLRFDVVPVFCGWDFGESLRLLSTQISKEFTHLNSIRMDSDDLLSREFIFRVNALIQLGAVNRYVVFPVGLRFDKFRWQRLDYVDNPFLSYCVRLGEFHNVLSINHERVRDFPCLVSDDADFRWAQYVHGTNVSNKFRDLQSYDGFKSYELHDNLNLSYQEFGLDAQAQMDLFDFGGPQ